MNKFLVSRLSRHANAGLMFHYMDSVQSTARRDPLLKRTRGKSPKYGWAFTLGLGLATAGLIVAAQVL